MMHKKIMHMKLGLIGNTQGKNYTENVQKL